MKHLLKHYGHDIQPHCALCIVPLLVFILPDVTKIILNAFLPNTRLWFWLKYYYNWNIYEIPNILQSSSVCSSLQQYP